MDFHPRFRILPLRLPPPPAITSVRRRLYLALLLTQTVTPTDRPPVSASFSSAEDGRSTSGRSEAAAAAAEFESCGTGLRSASGIADGEWVQWTGKRGASERDGLQITAVTRLTSIYLMPTARESMQLKASRGSGLLQLWRWRRNGGKSSAVDGGHGQHHSIVLHIVCLCVAFKVVNGN